MRSGRAVARSPAAARVRAFGHPWGQGVTAWLTISVPPRPTNGWVVDEGDRGVDVVGGDQGVTGRAASIGVTGTVRRDDRAAPTERRSGIDHVVADARRPGLEGGHHLLGRLGRAGRATTAVIGDQEGRHWFLRSVRVNASTIVEVAAWGYVRQDKPVVQAFRSGTVMDLLNGMARDTVTDLLGALKVTSSVYCLSEFRAPWGFRVEGQPVAKFHLVLDGAGWLHTDGADPIRLGPGELVILPSGDHHSISDDIATPVRDLDRIVAEHPLDADARLFYGGDGSRTRLLCGGFVLAEAMPARLLTLMPTVVRVDSALSGVATWLEPTFALLRHEADHATPGAQAILAKLADVFLAQALREFLVGVQRAGAAPLAPVLDTPIERAVALIHTCPDRQWTLSGLAREVGMSRTAFATRFRAAVGQPPMRHLARLRLGLAAGYLTTTNLSVSAIARRAGYDSDSSLSKAFKREFGASPGEYRRGRGHLTVTPRAAP